MRWIEDASNLTEEWVQVLSFEEYMDLCEKSPRSQIRNSGIYFKDLFDYFGKNDRDEFSLFKKSYPDSIPIYGQKNAQNNVYKNILNFCEEGFNNRLILLVGPNGSSKSSLIKKVMLAAEEYSKTDEGSLYSFTWVFPIESHIKGTMGLTASDRSQSLETYAHLEDTEISAIISSELRDHPFLLIPAETRKKLINEWFEDDPETLDTLRKSYLYNGELSKKNRLIFDALLKSYKGDLLKVLKHVRVERFIISKAQSRSAVTVEPQLHVDAKMQQITMDKRLAALPPSLQSLNLFQLSGENVLGNRGILEFSDLLKRPFDAFKYLLMTMETKSVNIQGILVELDILFLGTSNEVHLQAFQQHPDFNSFKGRMTFIRVPYLLNAADEVHIYDEQINNLKDKAHFEPHAIEALALFNVMTRIRCGEEKSYKDKKLGHLVAHMSPLEKVLFLSYKTLPERFNTDERQTLLMNFETIEAEFQNDEVYEGKFGISPREVKQVIYEMASSYPNISFVQVIEYLKKVIERKGEFHFLKISPQGNYHNPNYFIKTIKEHCLDEFDSELRASLGLVDDRSYESYISKYINQISALLKGEKIKSNITGKFELSDMYFIKEFEANINLKENPDQFRSHTISKLGAFSLDNPGQEIVYSDVFPDIIQRLKESFRNEQKKKIQNIAKNLVFYIAEKEQTKEKYHNPLSEDGRAEIENILANLKERYNYSMDGALDLLKYIIKERY